MGEATVVQDAERGHEFLCAGNRTAFTGIFLIQDPPAGIINYDRSGGSYSGGGRTRDCSNFNSRRRYWCRQPGGMDSQRCLRTGHQAYHGEQLGEDKEAHS